MISDILRTKASYLACTRIRGRAAMEVEALRSVPQRETQRCKREARFTLLATPKESKADWWTSFGPNLKWGNQEPIWPVSRAALMVIPTPRLVVLANPKQDHRPLNTIIPAYQYSCGRVSQIWQVASPAMSACCSERVAFLSRHKTVPASYLRHRQQFTYSCGRSSPVWRISQLAMSCPERPHTACLARPKKLHPSYKPARQVETVMSGEAMRCTPSTHTETLAQPKERTDGPFREPHWQISEATKRAIASDRTLELSRAKKHAEGYQPCREMESKVSTGAKNAVASNRMNELARPIIRDTMDQVQFNPEAFNVSETAKKAKASARIEELAQPITRGT